MFCTRTNKLENDDRAKSVVIYINNRWPIVVLAICIVGTSIIITSH